jgi:hypothetical protein
VLLLIIDNELFVIANKNGELTMKYEIRYFQNFDGNGDKLVRICEPVEFVWDEKTKEQAYTWLKDDETVQKFFNMASLVLGKYATDLPMNDSEKWILKFFGNVFYILGVQSGDISFADDFVVEFLDLANSGGFSMHQPAELEAA